MNDNNIWKGFLNLTPHTVKVLNNDGSFVELKPCGIVPRISTESKLVGHCLNVPIFKTQFGETRDLPIEKQNIFLIVSAMIRSAHPDRKDLISPKGLIRDDNGSIIGCEGFDMN